MILFKRIEVDLASERVRINRCRVYNDRQRKALNTLVDLFEQGKFQECLDHINNKKNFPYNVKGEYSEIEHIGVEIGDILHRMAHDDYYTQEQLLEQAKEKLRNK